MRGTFWALSPRTALKTTSRDRIYGVSATLPQHDGSPARPDHTPFDPVSASLRGTGRSAADKLEEPFACPGCAWPLRVSAPSRDLAPGATWPRSGSWRISTTCARSATPVEDALHAAGDLFDVPARYTCIETLLEEQKPDVFFVLLPTDGQTVAALAGIAHGCHIVTEIPYGLTLDMGDAIDRAAGAKGLKWEVAENVWLWPNERLKQKIAREGVLGRLTHARLRYPAGSYHGLNAVRAILDSRPRRATGYAQAVEVPPYKNYGGGDETARWWESGVIEFENDVACIYEMPTAPGAASGMNWDIEGLNGYLSGGELTLYNPAGRETYPIREIYEEVDGERVLARVQVDTDPPVAWDNPYKPYRVSSQDDVAKAAILESLHTAVTRDTDPQYGAAGGRLDYEMWVALRESADTGGRLGRYPA